MKKRAVLCECVNSRHQFTHHVLYSLKFSTNFKQTTTCLTQTHANRDIVGHRQIWSTFVLVSLFCVNKTETKYVHATCSTCPPVSQSVKQLRTITKSGKNTINEQQTNARVEIRKRKNNNARALKSPKQNK